MNGKWIERGSCRCADFADGVCKRCLEVGRFKFIEEEGKLPFLGDWQVLDVRVFQAFVCGCRMIKPINVVRRQFRLGATVVAVENETFLDVRQRRRHR